MNFTEEYEKKAEEARTQAKRSVRATDREAWLRIADEWMKLVQTREQPVNGVIGALSRIYASIPQSSSAARLTAGAAGLRIPTIVTTRSDGSRPPVPIDRDQCDGAVRYIC